MTLVRTFVVYLLPCFGQVPEHVSGSVPAVSAKVGVGVENEKHVPKERVHKAPQPKVGYPAKPEDGQAKSCTLGESLRKDHVKRERRRHGGQEERERPSRQTQTDAPPPPPKRARTLEVDQQQCGRPAVCLKRLAAMAGGAGAARRRRERRLRSCSDTSGIAAALQHSRDARPNVTYNAPRGQTTASSATRPGVLKEPDVQ